MGTVEEMPEVYRSLVYHLSDCYSHAQRLTTLWSPNFTESQEKKQNSKGNKIIPKCIKRSTSYVCLVPFFFSSQPCKRGGVHGALQEVLWVSTSAKLLLEATKNCFS